MKKTFLVILLIFIVLAMVSNMSFSNLSSELAEDTIETATSLEDTSRKKEANLNAVENPKNTNDKEYYKIEEESSIKNRDLSNINQQISKQFLICIDPGHQKKANLEKEPVGPGAKEMKIKVSQGTRGIITGKPEYVLCLEASLVLEEILKEKGFDVIMTRKTHDVDISNKERAEMANHAGADLFVRIHADGSNDPNMKGAHILIPAKDNLYNTSIIEESERAAKIVLEHLESHIELAKNSLSYRKDISGFNWSEVPVFLLEMGFMTNAKEDQKLSDPEYLRNLMELVADGIAVFLDPEESIMN